MTGTEVVARNNADGPSSGTLALRSDQDAWTATQRAALDQIGVGDAPAGDLQVFLHVAQRSGLDPFSRQLYMIGRWDSREQRKKWTIQTGIDGFRIIAERHRHYVGQVGPQWCADDGRWRDVWTETTPPAAARVGVLRSDWQQPVYATVMFAEFAERNRQGDLTPMWSGKSAHMIAKVAEAHALRKAFPQDLSGMYTEDEMAHVDNPPQRVVVDQEQDEPAEPDWDRLIEQHETARDRGELAKLWKLARGMRPNDAALAERIAQAGERVTAEGSDPSAAQQASAEVVRDAAPTPISERQSKRLHAMLTEGGINSRETKLDLFSYLTGQQVESSKDLTQAEADTVIAALESYAARGPLAEVVAEELDRASEEAAPQEPGQEPQS
jgi:phage recombination protein Bet